MGVKIGLIARAEDRGLGILTWEFARAMRPDRVLVVHMGLLAGAFATHLDRYPGATVVPFTANELPEAEVRAWLAGLDVVYSAETFYDWRVIEWAREAGVRTVCHAMPEFYKHAATMTHLPVPDAWWNPTPWRMDTMPAGTRLVPVPVATDRFPMWTPNADRPLRILHVVGKRAMADRNGTPEVLAALGSIRHKVEVTMVTQDDRLPSVRRTRGNVTVRTVLGGVGSYWQLYADQDVLLLPRRYGGLSLPMQEAMAAGLAVVTTDTSPNDWWPTLRVPCRRRGDIATGAGPVPVVVADVARLALAVDELAGDRDLLGHYQGAGMAWAALHSWGRLAPLYATELAGEPVPA